MRWRCYLWWWFLSSGPALAAPLQLLTEVFPPYQQMQNGNIEGWSVDIVQQILQAAKVPYQIDVMPWARALKTARDTPNTLIFSLLRTDDRENDFAWIAPLCPMRVSFYASSRRPEVQAADIQSALQYVVGVENGQANYHYLRDQGFRESRNLVVVGHNHHLRQMLKAGRIDLMLVSDVYVQQLPDQGAELRRVFTAHALEKYLYLAANPASDPVLLKQLRDAWQQVRLLKQPACQQFSAPPF